MRTALNFGYDALTVSAVGCALLVASCDKVPTTGPAPLSGSEMPGDRFHRLVGYQQGNVGLFAHHRFVFDFSDCSPLEALRLLFETAESTPPLLARGKAATPKIEFSPALVTALSKEKASGFFGVNDNGYPHFSVAEMVALLCLDHGIDLISADERIYRFDAARAESPMPPDSPVRVGAESGLSLFVSLPLDPADRGQVRLENRSAGTVRIGHPEDAKQMPVANPFATWSVLPVDDGVERRHPSPFAADQLIPGCGSGWLSYTGRVLELGPGETVDLTNFVPMPWEFSRGKVDGKFRAVLYLRNNPHLPFRTGDLSLSESLQTEIATSIRGTLDCLVLSNEVVFEASKRNAPRPPSSAFVADDRETVGKVYYKPK